MDPRLVADALWNATNDHGISGLELEFRLGHVLPGGHFSSNVGREPFAALRAALDASTSFDRVIDVETVETIGSTSVKHVTTLQYADSTASLPAPPPSFCMTKTKVFGRDAPLRDSPYVVRCSVAFEDIVPLTKQDTTRIVRHKKRRRYVWSGWAFDLTVVTSNGDVDAEETYEVEIELVDAGVLYERTMDSVVAWGLSLIDDVVRMLTCQTRV